MPPAGRPPLSRNIYSLESPTLLVPALALLDTSFVVEALIPSQPAHEACEAFLNRLAQQPSTICFNNLLEMELAEVVFRIALIDRFGRNGWKTARRDGRARRRARRLMEDALEAWEDVLAAFSYVRVGLEEVERAVPRLMSTFGLKSYDAVHAATAMYIDVEAIVALDSDFAALPSSIALYTTPGRMATCRERRPPRQNEPA